MTQSKAILRDLKNGMILTPMRALKRHGCLRLAARILDLKRDGHDIRSAMIERNGKRFAAYRLP